MAASFSIPIAIVVVVHFRKQCKIEQNFLLTNISNFIQIFAFSICTVFLMESIPKKHRVWTTLAISWSPNFIIIAGIAYFSQTWRIFYKVLGLLNIPTIVFLFLAYESPRWLIQKGMLKEAKSTYEKIERWNGTATPERQAILEELIKKEVEILKMNESTRKYYFHHLFYTWKMMIHSFVLSFSL